MPTGLHMAPNYIVDRILLSTKFEAERKIKSKLNKKEKKIRNRF